VYQPTLSHTLVEKKSETSPLHLICFVPTLLWSTTQNTDTEEYYCRALLERQTGKQRNDEHSALYHSSCLLNEGQRGMTASTKIPNAVFELLRCSFAPTIANIIFSYHSHIFNTMYAPVKQRQIIEINLVNFHGLFHKNLRKIHKNQRNYLVPIFLM
jgi:hypothetical protein